MKIIAGMPGPELFEAPPPLVEAYGVAKAYGRGATLTPVLAGIDLTIEAGRCVFLVGPSGSGKSTLLSILGCMLSPDAGSVHILGRDVAQLDARGRARLRRDKIGFVFQRFQLIRGLTALENVAVPLALRHTPPRRSHRRSAELLELVGLGDKMTSHPKHLSTGQCQRVALARALACDPPLLLADEPTASLDAATGLELMQLLRRLSAEHGKAAVVVTHDPRIYQFADEVFQLENGRLKVAPRSAEGHRSFDLESTPC